MLFSLLPPPAFPFFLHTFLIFLMSSPYFKLSSLRTLITQWCTQRLSPSSEVSDLPLSRSSLSPGPLLSLLHLLTRQQHSRMSSLRWVQLPLFIHQFLSFLISFFLSFFLLLHHLFVSITNAFLLPYIFRFLHPFSPWLMPLHPLSSPTYLPAPPFIFLSFFTAFYHLLLPLTLLPPFTSLLLPYLHPFLPLLPFPSVLPLIPPYPSLTLFLLSSLNSPTPCPLGCDGQTMGQSTRTSEHLLCSHDPRSPIHHVSWDTIIIIINTIIIITLITLILVPSRLILLLILILLLFLLLLLFIIFIVIIVVLILPLILPTIMWVRYLISN